MQNTQRRHGKSSKEKADVFDDFGEEDMLNFAQTLCTQQQMHCLCHERHGLIYSRTSMYAIEPSNGRWFLKEWQEKHVKTLYKEGNKNELSIYRTIMVSSIFEKLYGLIM